MALGNSGNDWTRHSGSAGHVVYIRRVGDDLGAAYISFHAPDPELDGGRTEPFLYRWSVEEGTCGPELESGSVDGDEGLDAAKRAADDALSRLFPALVD